MIVCIAEKPSVAGDIAHVLGANNRREGYYEGNGYQVTWTFGHLCELKEPHEYNTLWKAWSLGQLPMIPARFGIKLKDDNGIRKQFGIIERLMQAADSIINCGDAGQEGELIQRWVMQKAAAHCPVQRLWISSLTEDAIREGFQNLKDQSEYQSLYEAGLCRAIGDWTLGMNATRLYTIKYGGPKQLLSIGRVQTPTLALIVNRQREIDDFHPEIYWVLTTLYRDVTFTAESDDEDSAARGFKSKERAEAALEAIKGQPFCITDVQKKQGREAPPKLFDLTSLQVECNKKFSFSADKTLTIIQSLYEKKLATYPRVDTTFLPDDVYPKCAGILAGMTPYANFIQPIMGEGKKLPKSKKFFDNSKVTDHHAIIPTHVAVTSVQLSQDEKRVYDLIARRFIGAFYPDCKFEQTTVLGEVKPSDERQDAVIFKATGKRIIDPAWQVMWKAAPKVVAPGEEAAEDNDETTAPTTLPAFAKGEQGPHSPTLTEKQTTPPKPFTEATLLRAMETAGKLVEDDELRFAMKENGIGRPSTRAAIIETLFKRDYIRRNRKSLVPTPKGMELIGLIREELLKSVELTGIWERKLRQIERHEYDAAQFITELKQMVTDIVDSVLRDNTNRRIGLTAQ